MSEDKILELKMPEKLGSITVKIISSIQRHGKATGTDAQFYCNVRIWAFDDRTHNIFKMKITPSMWWSMHEELKLRELSGMDLEIDKQLICIVGKIVTIDALVNLKKTFVQKDGTIGATKYFKARFREDLEELDQSGSVDELKAAREKDWKENKHCIEENLIALADLIEKKENKEKEKLLKLREKQEKASKELKKFSNYWGVDS